MGTHHLASRPHSRAICLVDGGRFYKYWLVVTGEEHGMIWRDHRIDSLDLAPLFDARGNRMTFGRWLLARPGLWARASLRGAPHSARGHGRVLGAD